MEPEDRLILLGIVLGFLLLVAGVWYASIYYGNRGCAYVCEANGDENAYRWDAGCWCRDEEGVYNPSDSRSGQ